MIVLEVRNCDDLAMSPPTPPNSARPVGLGTQTRIHLCYSHQVYFTSFHGAVDLFFVNSRTYSRFNFTTFFVVCVNVNRQFSTRFQYSCDFPPGRFTAWFWWRPPFWIWCVPPLRSPIPFRCSSSQRGFVEAAILFCVIFLMTPARFRSIYIT